MVERFVVWTAHCLTRIEEPEPAGRSFPGEFVKMPMRDAPIDKLCESEHIALVTPPLLDKITPVNYANFFEGAVFE